jgi:methyl-accepting chemotaxis protein
MAKQDLVSELKHTIKDLNDEKEDLHKAIHHKESRNKQILIRLEQANNDVDSVSKHAEKVKKDNDELKLKVSTLKAKLKDYEPDKEVELTQEDVENMEESEDPELRSVASEKYNKFGEDEE